MGRCECGSTDFKEIGQTYPPLTGVDLVACKKCGRVYAENLMKQE
jgi:hypothetical protein